MHLSGRAPAYPVQNSAALLPRMAEKGTVNAQAFPFLFSFVNAKWQTLNSVILSTFIK